MSQIDDALNTMLGKKKQSSSSTIPNNFGMPSLGLSSMFTQTTKAVRKSNIIQGIKKDAKKAFQPLFQLADTSKILGASTYKQDQWKNMSGSKRVSARKKYSDRDGDRVPDRYDCQPRNIWRQDDNVDKIIVGDRVSSIGGFFVEGIVKKVSSDGKLLTIQWIKDSRRDEPINFVQTRSVSIVRKL